MVATTGTQHYTEHTVKVADGIDIYYTDSGAPPSGDYTTLIVLHGSAINGAVFIPLHEYAHRVNLRVVLWNRRDYHGTTKYSDEELTDLKAGRQVFQERHAFQLASFLEHFITTKDTPKLSSDRKTSGFILMGWSFGNATTMSLFANPQVVPKSLYSLIEPYIMSIVLYDAPYTAMGYPPPTYSGAYYPFEDPDYAGAPERFYHYFLLWVSSHYNHTDVTSRNASGLDYRKGAEKWTIGGWSDEQKALCIENATAIRSELPCYAPPMQALLKRQTHDALFNENLAGSYFPNVHVHYLVAKNSTWFVLWGYIESMRLYEEARNRGQIVRATNFVLVEGANHFLHYENPELMLQLVIAGARQESSYKLD
ncbi:Alpha/Beta hydrolase protein [Collybia nuda]|uniref:Alpha/Beta hydrolase protein n=1 Tax=Collybia nuda TaxID=64659 RepID=A0A9P5Y685_9AGAR|nr:Alpha/Beta hydrolase protein [Collybia nuda]